ncbi:MAG: hypothetical protein C0425_02465 [Chlorobiaceae bacterium]|nr:hypothetical protein [Chlorobiaceae bacterium]MBA4309184.1 hypothetical protein [Chlorobiaceae bacterium]
MKFIIASSLLIFLFVGTLFAQGGDRRQQSMQNRDNMPTGKISGRLIDAESLRPIEYGNFAIFRYRDSSVVGGAVSNADGFFLIDKVPVGRYYARITFVGFRTERVDSIFVFPRNLDVNVGEIKITSSNVRLGEVVVSADKDFIVNEIDKKVINVEKDLSSAGGTALDVMQNVPAVAVDISGNISYRGSSNLTILIDGKPSIFSGLSNGDVLSQLPVSSIERIEFVTNPSVKYDPEGTAGIINVILKKKIEGGINAITSLNLGTGDKYNSSVNANYRVEKFNFFASYDNRFNNSRSSGSTDRFSMLPGLSSSILEQDFNSFNKMRSHNVNAGFDFLMDDFNTLSFSFKYRNFTFDNNNNTTEGNFISLNSPTSLFDRNNRSTRDRGGVDYTLSHKKTFSKAGEEWTTDIIYSDNAMVREEHVEQIGIVYLPVQSSLNSIRRSFSNNDNVQFVAQSNYNLPFDNHSKIEFGFKSQITDLSTANRYENFDPTNSVWFSSSAFVEDFNYKQQIHAVYGMYGGLLLGFRYQLGLRAEQVFSTGTLLNTNQSFDSDYFSLYPSLNLGYTIAEGNDLTFSYSRRVDRPSLRQLNPFVDNSDSLNISRGNPDLLPQYINSLEANWSFGSGRTFINTSAFYRQTNDVISSITVLQNNGITSTTFQNIAKSSSLGGDLSITQPVATWLRLSANVSAFNSKVSGAEFENIDQSKFTYTSRVSAAFTFWDKTQIQFSGMYMSPSIMMGGFGDGGGRGGGGGGMGGGPSLGAQTKMNEMYGFDLALRKDLFDDKLTLTFRLSDIFNNRRFSSETVASTFNTSSFRKFDSRVFFIGISYKFNNYKRDRERINIDDDGSDL